MNALPEFLAFFFMAKELPYFKFEPSEWENGSIQMCSRELKGLFIDVCAMYWARLGDLPYALALQKLCNGNANQLQELCTKQILALHDDMIVIGFLDEQLEEVQNLSKKRSNAAKKRWNGVDANAMQMHSKSNAIRREENRIEEIYTSRSNAYDEITNNYIDIQNSTAILSNKGWSSVQEADVQALVYHFLESKADLEKEKKDVRQHFKNWINRESLDDLIKLTVTINAKRERQQRQQT